MSKRLAFLADPHIGYKARVRSNKKGINIRVQDGYDALQEALNQIVVEHEKEPITALIIGGDLFHVSRPTMRDIVIVQHFMRELSKRGIEVVILAGNHDATDNRSELAAVAPVHDPDKKIFAYIDPYTQHVLDDGLMLHVVSHHGLGGEEAPTVTPVNGYYNVFTTHGAALDPKNQTLMRCIDSPREQFIPVEMIIDDNFVAKLLGHYHSRYAVGDESLNAWYGGSLVRRGFSDAPGARGWLLVTIDDNGKTTFTAHDIKQRPQFDLETIDADGKTASDVMNLLEISMGRTLEAEKAPIVRQRIINTNRGIREGMDKDRIAELSNHMLSWQLEFPKGEQKESKKERDASISLGNKHSVNIVSSYKDWIKDQSKQVPEQFRDVVVKDAEKYLTEARELNFKDGH